MNDGTLTPDSPEVVRFAEAIGRPPAVVFEWLVAALEVAADGARQYQVAAKLLARIDLDQAHAQLLPALRAAAERIGYRVVLPEDLRD